MKRCWLQSAVLVCALTASLHAQSRTALLKAVDEARRIGDPGTPEEFDAPLLDKFDPKLAPALRLYGPQGVVIQTWTTPAGNLRATLFEMLDSPAAYGFYTLQRSSGGGEATPTQIGADSFRRGNSLFFWQSNYAVRIEGPAASQNDLATILSRSIRGHSRKPPVADYLPAEGIVAGTERYILSPEEIDPAIGVDGSQLGFDSSAEAAAARYRINGAEARLLLVLFPTQHVAKKYSDGLQIKSSDPEAFKKRAGPLLAIVYGTTNKAIAQTILEGISHEFKVTWNEPKPDLAIGTMIVTIFTFIGIALAFTLILGVGFGGLRVFVKSRYPNRLFDRSGEFELIQLKLIQGVTEKQIGSGESSGRV